VCSFIISHFIPFAWQWGKPVLFLKAGAGYCVRRKSGFWGCSVRLHAMRLQHALASAQDELIVSSPDCIEDRVLKYLPSQWATLVGACVIYEYQASLSVRPHNQEFGAITQC
jgi:hypothetical protein